MNVGSLFSGIGGIDLGLEQAGMRVVFQCEADPWRRAVLRSHWPDIPCYEDVRDVAHADDRGGRGHLDGAGIHAGLSGGDEPHGGSTGGSVDLLCGGFPCQDLSVAGRRAGLEGARSSLFFEFARIADAVRPRWLLIENVPGLLSSNGGRDFAVVYATLAELGYGLAWRILDSRYFGVPQRRRRVFIVGHLGATGAAPFLPFLEGGAGDPAAGGEAGEDAAVASLSGLGTGGPDDNDGQQGRLVADTVGTRRRHSPGDGETLVTAYTHSGGETYNEAEQVGALTQQSANETSAMTPLVAAPLSHGSHPNSNAAGRRREDDANLVVPISAEALRGEGAAKTPSPDAEGNVRLRDPGLAIGDEGDPAYTLAAAGPGAVGTAQAVRRLTPTECCRLQGFPDDWLGPPNQPPDSPRYAALGDAVTVNVAHWIGQRILEADRNLRSVAA